MTFPATSTNRRLSDMKKTVWELEPIFSADATADKKNTELGGEELIERRVSAELADSFGRYMERAENIEKRAKLPLPMRIAEYVSGFLSLMLLGGIVEGAIESEKTVAQILERAGWLIGVALALGAVGLFFFLKAVKLSREVYDSDEALSVAEALEDITPLIYNDLGVPEDAPFVDLWHCRYKKKGEAFVILPSSESIHRGFICSAYRVFVDGEGLCLADLEARYRIPLECIEGVYWVNKRASFHGWTKDEEIKSEKYKEYKITETDEADLYLIKPICFIALTLGGVERALFFPPYELSLIEELLGMTAREANADEE